MACRGHRQGQRCASRHGLDRDGRSVLALGVRAGHEREDEEDEEAWWSVKCEM
jgi:hypothetical protein